MNRECAVSVALSTEPIGIPQQKPAPRSAEPVYVRTIERLKTPARVYNLSVAETPEYFAQGILVHNCIAAGVAWLAYSRDLYGIALDKTGEGDKIVEYGSWLWREEQERLEQRKGKLGSPSFGLKDVVREL